MKKLIFILLILIIVTGCKKEIKKEEENILSTGTLECILKQKRTNDESMYTSYFIFYYNNDGILKKVEDYETLDVTSSEDEIKEEYKKSYLETLNLNKDKEGIKVEDLSKEDIYKLKLIYDISLLDKDIIKKYNFDLDRKSTAKLYKDFYYTCK